MGVNVFIMKNECPLCKLEPITKCYYEDNYWKIMDCKDCNGIVAVYKEHTMKVELVYLIFILNKIRELFGDCDIRTKQRRVKDHFHFHLFQVISR